MEKELRDFAGKSGATVGFSVPERNGYVALHFGAVTRLAYAKLQSIDWETGHLRPEPEQIRALRSEPGIYACQLAGNPRTAYFLVVEVFSGDKAGELRRKLEDKIRKDYSALAEALN